MEKSPQEAGRSWRREGLRFRFTYVAYQEAITAKYSLLALYRRFADYFDLARRYEFR